MPKSSYLLFCILIALSARSRCLEHITVTESTNNDNDARLQFADNLAVNGSNNDTLPNGRTFLLLHLLKEKLKKLHALDAFGHNYQPTGCVCVAFYLCGPNGTYIGNNVGVIDIRFRRCSGDYEVCCFLRIVIQPPSTIPTTTTTTTTTMKTTPSTIPTTPSRPPSTIPTTMTTTTTTTTTTTPRPIPYSYPCYCVPVYQCVIVGGQVYGSSPYLGACTGALVCCSYYSGAATAPLVLPNLLTVQPVQSFPSFVFPQQQQTVILPQPQPPAIVLPQPPSVVAAPLPPIIYGQSCVCVLVAQCSLGYLPVTGIDPRQVIARQGQGPGTCTASGSMCCKVRQETATQQQQQQPQVTTGGGGTGGALQVTADVKNPGTPDACVCIPSDQCAEGQAVTFDGVGAIDPRFGPCQSSTLVCCRLSGRQQQQQQHRADIVVAPSSSSADAYSVLPTRALQRTLAICGIQNTTYAAPPALAGTAYFAEFPWMALLLVRQTGLDDVFQCGGSLITGRAVLTAAHCVISTDPKTLIVRLGELNTRNTNEPLAHQELSVQRFVVHPQYYAGALYNDVALIVLAQPAAYAAHIRPVCLPSQGQKFADGTVCYATGWGRSSFGPDGAYQTIMRKVDLPIIGNSDCQARLRQTRLGTAFQLHSSFLCAGGEANKDTCYKDGGGPLVCKDATTRRFAQAGIVSWGIGCGDKTPGVYANVAQAQQWIVQQLQINGATD